MALTLTALLAGPGLPTTAGSSGQSALLGPGLVRAAAAPAAGIGATATVAHSGGAWSGDLVPLPADVQGSTATNWYVGNWSTEGTIAVDPGDPGHLVAGGIDLSGMAQNNSTYYASSGLDGAFWTNDSGVSWSQEGLPPSPQWSNAASPEWCHIHFGNAVVVFGPNRSVYYFDLSGPRQYGSGCPAGNLETLGLYVMVSRDGGVTWGSPVTIRGNATSYSVDKPWAAVDPATGEVYVAYVDDFTGGATFLQNSTDQGQHWSPPVQVSTGLGNMRGVQLGVDAYRAVDALWVDQNTGKLFFARSTDRGESFASQTQVATALETTTSTISPAGQAPLFPALGAGTALAPGGRVPLYAVWQNGSGGAANDPEIDLSWSITNGTTWSSPTRVNSILSLESFEPSVTVASDGTVYVVWYAMDPASGVYRFVGAVSHDRGRTFGLQFNISDVPSETRYAAVGYDLPVGDNTDIVPEGTGARPIWTDARSPLAWNVTGQSQFTYAVNSSLYTALLVNDSIASSVPTNISVAGGVPDKGSLPTGPLPTPVDWVAGASYTLTAPNTTSWNGSTWSFAYWYGDAGLNSSEVGTSQTLNGTVQPDRHLTACYVQSAGRLCQGSGAPGLIHLSVHPSFATAELDGAPIALLTGGASLLEPPGNHTLAASATGFSPRAVRLYLGPGSTTYVELTLTPYPGQLTGRVAPASAVVSFNGTRLPVAANGSFSATEDPGTYTLSASAPGYVPYSGTVMILPNGTTTATLDLVTLSGYLTVQVTPSSASLALNGAPVTAAGGAFSSPEPPGTYWVNASAPGFAPASAGPLVLAPAAVLPVWLNLSRYDGTVFGTVEPANASVALNGTGILVAGGSFSVAVPWGVYSLEVHAFDRRTLTENVAVAANATTALSLALPFTVGWAVGVIDPNTAALTVDGAASPVTPSGAFNVTLAPGTHWVNGSESGYMTVARQITITAGNASTVSLTLSALTGQRPVWPLWVATMAVFGTAVAAGAWLWTRRRSRSDRPPIPRAGR